MVKVTYVESDGVSHGVDVPAGMNLMSGALNNGVPGIEGDCGGAAACATCRVFLDPVWLAIAGPAGPDEREMIDLTDDSAENTRLSCQIIASEALEGLILKLPAAQR
ncbi:MAG: Ferredoxin [Bradyrhizobium sp.]|nr:Ferredoxin [Bradyrhizobium sp.]